MALRLLAGFETGDLSEFQGSSGSISINSSIVKDGVYSIRVNPSGAAISYGTFVTQSTTIAFRFSFRIATAPASGSEIFFSTGDASGIIGVEEFFLRLNSSRQIVVINANGSTVATGSTVLALDTWYAISGHVEYSDTGAYSLFIDGASELSGTSDFSSGFTQFNRTILGKAIDVSSQSVDFYYDSIVIGDDSTVPNYATAVIARSPITGGTPSSNAWTKSTGTDAGALWDDTPFDAATFCVSPSSGDPLAQTAEVAPFSSTQSGHGSETIASTDTIVGIQTVAIAKRSSGGGRTHEVSYKLGAAAAVDTVVSLSTSDAVVRSTVATSVAYADLNDAEIGGEKSGGASGQSMTIEDCWLMAAYIFVPPAAELPYQPWMQRGPVLAQ